MAFACMALLSGYRGLLGGLTVSAEDAGRHELTELVAHHVFRDVDRNELIAVVHRERVADELRQHGRTARPGLEHALLAAAVHRLDLAYHRVDDVGTFANRTSHERGRSFLLRTTPHDELVAQLALAGLETLGDLAPRRARMTAAGALALAAAHRMVDRIHGDAAHARMAAQPSHAPRLAVGDVLVIEVPDLAHHRAAVHVELA